MASLAVRQAMEPRRRQATYGKPSRKAQTGLFESLDAADTKPTSSRPTPVLKSPRKPLPAPRSTNSKTDVSLDDFDIPSSDEEHRLQSAPARATGRLVKVTRTVSSVTKTSLQASNTNKKRKLEAPWNDAAGSVEARKQGDSLKSKALKVTQLSSPHGSTSSQTSQRSESPVCMGKKAQSTFRSKDSPRRTLSKSSSRSRPTIKAQVQQTGLIDTEIRSSAFAGRKQIRSVTQSRSCSTSDVSARGSSRSPPGVKLLSPPTVATPSTPRRSVGPIVSGAPTSGFSTPRQAKLWNCLLLGDSPSRNFDGLSLDTMVHDGIDEPSPEPEPTPRRRRLIDTLKLSAPESISSDPTEEGDVTVVDDGGSENMGLETNAQGELSQSSQVSIPSLAGPKFTYGAQRSYLEETDNSLEALLLQPIGSPAFNQAAKSRPEDVKHDMFGFSDDEAGESKLMRSAHELKAAGNSGAFANEISMIFDDIENRSKSGLSSMRSAMMELSRKLTDATFRSRFIQGGHEGQLFSIVHGTRDEIACAVISSLVVLLLGGDKDAANPAGIFADDIVTITLMAIANDRELAAVARDRRSNMSKVAQNEVRNLQSRLLQMTYWHPAGVESLSPRLIGLKALELLVRKLRESGNITEPVLNKDMMTVLQSITKESIEHVGTNRTPARSTLFAFETTLSILESCTVAPSCVTNTSVWNRDSMGHVANSLEAALSLTGREGDGAIPLLALRLVVTLANHSPNHADWLATGPLIHRVLVCIRQGLGKEQETLVDHSKLDLLVLGLGAMINLTECSDKARQAVADQCMSYIDGFVDAFNANRTKSAEADSMEASQANVAYGYLAVLFGHLCQTPVLQQRIQSRLPGKSLDAVIEAVEEFIAYHQEADKRAKDNEAYASFTERLKAVVATLHRLGG